MEVEEDAEREKIRNELSSMSFEELLKLKEKLGTKVINSAIHGNKQKVANFKSFKRENKNRPRETTAKRPVSNLRPIYDIKPPVHRDPRFDDLSGEFKEDLFNKSYKFLQDIRSSEKNEVEKKIATEKDPETKAKLKSLAQSMAAKEIAQVKKENEKKASREQRKQHKEVVKEGKKPWFQNKAEKRKLDLLEKYEMLKKSGKLEKYMAKKRKKNASKDKTKLPKLTT